jgi:hypothetical protein
MDRIVGTLNNRYLIAVVVGLFVVGVARRFVGR